MFTPNYQGDPSWTQLGAIYLGVLGEIDRPKMVEQRARIAAISSAIATTSSSTRATASPTSGRGPLYHCDEGMIWAALFLDLYR